MEAGLLAFEEINLTAGLGKEGTDDKTKHEGRNNRMLWNPGGGRNNKMLSKGVGRGRQRERQRVLV